MNTYPNLKEFSGFARQGYNLLPVYSVVSAELISPIVAYMKLQKSSHSKRAFLLESADGGEQVGRYSFIGNDPVAEWICKDGGSSYVEYHHKEAKSRDQLGEVPANPLDMVSTYLNRWRSPRYPELPPFQGGAIGYMAYDSIRFLESIPLPSAKIDCGDFHLMFFHRILVFDRLKHQIFLIQNVKVDTNLDKAYKEACESLRAFYQDIFSDAPQHQINVSPLRIPVPSESIELDAVSQSMGHQRFVDGVKTIKNHIRSGDVFQCVLSEAFSSPLVADPFHIYRNLRMVNPSPYLFYLQFAEEVLLGASPEMLVKVTGQSIATCPIAGTRPRGSDVKQDHEFEKNLLRSTKERAEHLMLVDLGRNDLGRVAKLGSVKVSRFMAVERFSHVMHLTSLVEATLRRGLSSWDALRACFPAGTLTGAPKVRAMEIISSLERERRGTYGGAVVAFDFAGNLNSCITIRSMWVKNGIARIQAGAGVVADSRPEMEYQEVLGKAKAMRTAMALTRNLEPYL